MRLKDKTAIITGAASGIGRETALLFAEEGASILAVDVNEEGVNETTTLITDKGGKADYILADVSKASDCEKMVQTAEEKFEKLHILFNNAGIMHGSDDDAINTEEDVWDLTMAINLKGVFLGCKYGIPALRRAG
ncbi:MAG: SDR family NAD(P)-dependent oxidoreductase, partial [Deltaproteobacteria bacterium]|nr:SDR family NAD(P)-dependent oxidoreductase [Deltaproteobacteria bacterium]